jgi:hypothetical protein
MDLLTFWKASSIILTGTFGILGLLKDYKDKVTGQITKWGRVSMLGIVASTIFGVVALIVESAKDRRAREKTAVQALATAQNTQQAVEALQRMLSSLDEPQVELGLMIQCDEPKYKDFCEAMIVRELTESGYADAARWRKWPGGPKATVDLDLLFFRNSDAASKFLQNPVEVKADLEFTIDANNWDSNPASITIQNWLVPYPGSKPQIPDFVVMNILEPSPRIQDNSLQLLSVSDFAEAVVIIQPGSDPNGYFYNSFPGPGIQLFGVYVRTKRGLTLECREFHEIKLPYGHVGIMGSVRSPLTARPGPF